jgi:hypothetical protein
MCAELQTTLLTRGQHHDLIGIFQKCWTLALRDVKDSAGLVASDAGHAGAALEGNNSAGTQWWHIGRWVEESVM